MPVHVQPMGAGAVGGSIKLLKFATGPINAAVRVHYVRRLGQMAALAPRLRRTGNSSEQIARKLVDLRNRIKLEARAKMSAEGITGKTVVKGLELVNFIRYRNRFGPTAEYLLKKKGNWEAVIEGALRSNAAVNRFFGLGVL